MNLLRQGLGQAFRLMLKMIARYRRGEISALSAQLTYYFILSFFPFLIFLMNLISYTPFSSELLLKNLQPLLAERSYEMIEAYVQEIGDNDPKTILSLSILGTLWASSTGVLAMMKGLNKAYGTLDKRSYWKIRGIAIVFTLGFAGISVISLSLLVFGSMIWHVLSSYYDLPRGVYFSWNVVQLLIPIMTMFIVFTWIYVVVPNRSLRVKQVLPGAIFTTVGSILISMAFAFYVNLWGSFYVYGSIGGVIVLLIWLYISSIMILLGGQLNAMLMERDQTNSSSAV
jgi:membrane protein